MFWNSRWTEWERPPVLRVKRTCNGRNKCQITLFSTCAGSGVLAPAAGAAGEGPGAGLPDQADVRPLGRPGNGGRLRRGAQQRVRDGGGQRLRLRGGPACDAPGECFVPFGAMPAAQAARRLAWNPAAISALGNSWKAVWHDNNGYCSLDGKTI